MNKAELVTALAEHLDGDRKTAATAVDGLLDVIVRTVSAGDSVSVTGFGVFERRERAARSGRNPRTGEVIQVAATAIPAFRPGAGFRNVVSGARGADAPTSTGSRSTSGRATSARSATTRSAARSAATPAPVAAPAPTSAPVPTGNGKVTKAGAKAAVKGAGKGAGKDSDKGSVSGKDTMAKATKEAAGKNGKTPVKAEAKGSVKSSAKKKAKK